MAIAVLIGVMISVVVGVSLIPAIFELTNKLSSGNSTGGNLTGEQLTGPTTSLLAVLPYVLIAVLVLGTIAWMGSSLGIDSPEPRYQGGSTDFEDPELERKIKEFSGKLVSDKPSEELKSWLEEKEPYFALEDPDHFIDSIPRRFDIESEPKVSEPEILIPEIPRIDEEESQDKHFW